jgi:S-adenosylmethionine hydrolase
VPIITLTTDFGLADHYVGTLKGVLFSRCPNLHIADITHALPPFSLYAGAYAISQAAPWFPPGTIHVVVVDPGVGSSRRVLVVEALDQLFLAPDNGVLSLILARDPAATVRVLENPRFFPPNPSPTFHGRDIFAPAAATLACNLAAPSDAGPVFTSPLRLANLEPILIASGLWRGIVLSVDRFGNVITNFQPSSHPLSLEVAGKEIREFRSTFSEAPPGLPFVYLGSSGYLEIALNQQSAATLLGVASGDTISLRLRDTIV